MTQKKTINRASSSISTKKVQETPEHARLKTTLKEIINASGFSFNSEISLNFSGNLDDDGNLVDERSIDVAAYGSSKHKSFLIIFECKSGTNLKEVNQKISSWEADIEKIRNGKAKVISSDETSIKNSNFKKFDDIRICYVFGNSLSQDRYDMITPNFKRNIYTWNNSALAYKKTANTVGKALKYQILQESE